MGNSCTSCSYKKDEVKLVKLNKKEEQICKDIEKKMQHERRAYTVNNRVPVY